MVPPARFAVLLKSRRAERGLDLETLASQSAAFSVSQLAEIERGQVEAAELRMADLVALYDLDAGPVVPARSELVLDLEQKHVRVGSTALSFEQPTAALVLERYVSLLYLLRDETPGRRLTLRDDDLDVLGHALLRSKGNLVEDLERIMGGPKVGAGTERISRAGVIMAAGLLVGATAAGSLIMVAPTSTSDATPVAAGASSALIEPGYRAPAVADVSLTEVALTPAVSSAGEAAIVAKVAGASAAKVAPVTSTQDRHAAAAEPATNTTEPATETTEPVTEAVEPATEASSAESRPDELGRLAQDLVDFDIGSELPGWTVEFAGDNPSLRGLTNSRTRSIVVFVEPGDTSESVAQVLMHEVGHAIDLERLSDDLRRDWISMRGMPSVWWAGDGLNDFAVGAGDFAEAVAVATTGSPSNSIHGEFTADQLNFVNRILSASSKR